MARYFCEYCNVHLSHDSPRIRKEHLYGWRHATQVKAYYMAVNQDKLMRTIVEIAKDYEARRELVPVPAPLLLKPPNSARIAPHMQSSILPVPQMHLIPGLRPFAPPGVSNMIPQRPGFAPAPNFVTSSSMPPPNIPVLNTAGGMFYPGAPPPNIMHPGMQSVTMPNPNLSFSNIPPGMHPAMQNQSYAPPSVIHHRPSNNQFNSPSNPPINPHLSNPRYPNPHHHSQIHHQNPRQTNAQTQSSSHASRQNQAMRPPANYSNKSQIQPRNPRS